MERSSLLLQKLWNSFHEPRVITFVVIWFYLACVFFGGIITHVSVNESASWIPDYLSFTIGGFMVVTGTIGVPAAWTGTWWLERGAAVMLVLNGALMSIASWLAVHDNQALVDKPIAWFAILSGASYGFVGLTRWFRVGKDPYAPWCGPMLPQRRIEKAQVTMRIQEKEAMLRASRN